ncbi:MAG: 50S ribosomal protein L15 [Deltaproteobacteria bacterium]|nr:50S ribosomal protein L15 [Deltaproteobacteria bacterium]
MLDRLKAPEGAVKRKKRLGRGEGSGRGKTAGRGNKGQRARTGGGTKAGFEGGQMPLQRRTPKRGFTNIFKHVYSVLNVGRLAGVFSSGDIVNAQTLVGKGLLKTTGLPFKVLGEGDIKIPLTVRAGMFSKSAKAKIEAAGGKAEVV